MVVPFFPPATLILWFGGSGRGEEPSGGKCPPPDSNPFNDAESAENRASLSRQFAAAVNRRFEFQKRGQQRNRLRDALQPLT